MTETIKISKLKGNPSNPRLIKDDKFAKLVQSIKDFPEMLNLRPIVVNKDMVVLGGNMRLKACKEAGLKEVPVTIADNLTPEQEQEFIIKDNVSGGEWDWEILKQDFDFEVLDSWGVDLPSFEVEEKELEAKEVKNKLTDIYLIPPFSVLDTRKGYWNDRKRYWRELIGDNGESREGTLTGESQDNLNNINGEIFSDVSLLDPVLAEIVNKWFGLEKCKTFDCFAGDTVFGYVSNAMGNTFTGIELRKEQVDLNNGRIGVGKSKYICDDGINILNHLQENTQDLLFSCPPYFNLEVYSDLPNDASNQKDYKDFLAILRKAFKNAIKALKQNRFAVICVGDIRDNFGYYYRFVDDIKDIFKDNGMLLYNELILFNTFGTLKFRASKLMEGRKIGKCHQNVLVFYNGNPKDIKKHFPKLEFKEDYQDDESADVPF